MNLSRLRSLAWALLALPVLLAGPFAQAATVAIRDEAGFFSESAKAAASKVVSDIKANQKRDLVIETYREIPAAARKGVDLQDKAALKRVFETWSVQRARELGVQGVYVVLTREPAHLQVAVGNETLRQAFTTADRNALADTMLERLRAKKYDDALIAGVGFVRDTLIAHQSPQAKPSGNSRTPAAASSAAASSAAPASGSSEAATGSQGSSFLSRLLPLLLLGIVILVVIRLIGSLFGRGLSGGMQPGFGGGGFLQSMLGGIFGAAAGMWLYNQFTGSAFGADTPPPADSGADTFGGQDSDYSSSGGDFGDSSGGGDSGGGGDF